MATAITDFRSSGVRRRIGGITKRRPPGRYLNAPTRRRNGISTPNLERRKPTSYSFSHNAGPSNQGLPKISSRSSPWPPITATTIATSIGGTHFSAPKIVKLWLRTASGRWIINPRQQNAFRRFLQFVRSPPAPPIFCVAPGLPGNLSEMGRGTCRDEDHVPLRPSIRPLDRCVFETGAPVFRTAFRRPGSARMLASRSRMA